MMKAIRSRLRRLALTISGSPRARPGPRFLFASPAHFLALGFGAGLAPVAPGTFGTLVAWPLFWLLQKHVDTIEFVVIVAVLYVLGIWICGRTGRDLGVQDHKAIVWDEIVAFLLVLFFTPRTLAWQCIAFVLFRLFDAVKPGPIRIIESRFHGGFGVMVDDIAAAFFTLLCLTAALLLVRALGDPFGLGTVFIG
jgi:phosphatidylglycerophosphatase A